MRLTPWLLVATGLASSGSMAPALRGAAMSGVVFGALACSRREEPAAVAEARPNAQVPQGLRRQPRPGERVPQPELDGYCDEPERGAAYYYHGGSPVVRVAREAGCTPLYITECEVEGRCYPPRDQEPGMWCCAAHDQPGTAATAKR